MPKVLVVDDDHDLVFLIKEAFESQGFEVITAYDGAQALKLLKTEVPDAMIVDLTMPVMSGWHFTVKVRKDDRFKNTPILVLSGLLDHESQPDQYDPANAYIDKPFEIFELIERVKKFLQKP